MDDTDTGLAAQLEELLHQLAGGRTTAESAGLAVSRAAAVRNSALGFRAADSSVEELEALRRVIDTAASRLAPVLAALQRRLWPAVSNSASHIQQLHAACGVMSDCLSFAPACGASSEARLQLARGAVACVVHSGLGALTAWTALLSDDRDDLRQRWCATLRLQLELANMSIRAPGWSAAAAAQAAPPAQLAAWLAAAVHLMKRLAGNSGTAQRQRELLPWLVAVCNSLASGPAWKAHLAEIAQPPLGQGIVQLFLSFTGALAVALPLPEDRRPVGYDWERAAQVAELLLDAPLHAALQSHLEVVDGSSAAAAVTAAAQLVQQLLLAQPPTGFSQRRHSRDLQLLFAQLAMLCSWLRTSSVPGQLSLPQRQRIATQLLPLAGLPLQLRHASPSSQGAQFTADHQQLLLASVAAACSSTQLLGTLWTTDRDTSVRAGNQRPAALLTFGSADAAAWCSAACAALRCIPLVQQLHSLGCRLTTPASFADSALDLAWCANFYVRMETLQRTSQAAAAAAAAADGAVHLAAWQVHSRVAQLVHFMAAAEQPLLHLGDEDHAEKLLVLLSDGLIAMTHLLETGSTPADGLDGAPPCPRTRQRQALCAAYAAALLVCESHFPLAQHNGAIPLSVLGGLTSAIAHGPLAVGLDPALHLLLGQLLGKVALEDRRALQAWHYELDSAARGPCLAALLVSRGYLDQFLRTFGQEAASRTAASNVLGSLRKAAADALTATSKAASEGTPAVEEAVARDRLQQALQAYAGTTPLRYPSLSNVQRHVLPPARQLAAALLDWWRRPSAQQEQQLEAAQAAAARSCAYLGCTNLGGGGGPAAGQGEGSMRCSACRAVWYCGTACSHADWRVGHKRVCKALGTARAAAKAARRQAAEPAGEAAEQPA